MEHCWLRSLVAGAWCMSACAYMPVRSLSRGALVTQSPGISVQALPRVREHDGNLARVRRRSRPVCLEASAEREGAEGECAECSITDDENPGDNAAANPGVGARETTAENVQSSSNSKGPASTGTDPKMMSLERYAHFPHPPVGAAEVDFRETKHSGGLAMLRLYHEAERPVVVHYWYKSCAMCKVMKPVIQRVVNEYAEEIYYVDVEISANKKTMKYAGVRSIPAIQVYKRGKMVSHFSGLQTVSGMRKHFQAAVNHEQIRGLVELGTLMSGWGSSLPSSTTLEREKDLSSSLSGANSAPQSSLHSSAPSASRNSSSLLGGAGSLESSVYQEPHPDR